VVVRSLASSAVSDASLEEAEEVLLAWREPGTAIGAVGWYCCGGDGAVKEAGDGGIGCGEARTLC